MEGIWENRCNLLARAFPEVLLLVYKGLVGLEGPRVILFDLHGSFDSELVFPSGFLTFTHGFISFFNNWRQNFQGAVTYLENSDMVNVLLME